MRALGNDGFHSLTPHTHFQAEGHTSDETTSGVLVPLVLAITMVAGGAIAVVAYRSGRFTPPRD